MYLCPSCFVWSSALINYLLQSPHCQLDLTLVVIWSNGALDLAFSPRLVEIGLWEDTRRVTLAANCILITDDYFLLSNLWVVIMYKLTRHEGHGCLVSCLENNFHPDKIVHLDWTAMCNLVPSQPPSMWHWISNDIISFNTTVCTETQNTNWISTGPRLSLTFKECLLLYIEKLFIAHSVLCHYWS